MTTPATPSGPRLLTTGVLTLVTLASLSACGSGSTSSAPPAPSSAAASSGTPSDSASTGAQSQPSRTSSPAPTDAPVPVESNPPGDIPDNLAFVPYANSPGGYAFTHPEGWARTGKATQVTFTDKLNGVTVDSATSSSSPTVANAKASIVPRLQRTLSAFELMDVTPATLPSGTGVHIVYRRNSAPDPVTGKIYRDEVEEYVITAHGTQVTMDLFGPVGADNVDAYATMSQSLSIR